MAARRYDVVLFGATGFTGGLTAEYLARHAPEGCRWALAGRNRERLQRLRDRLATIDPACVNLPIVHADAGDPESLRDVAESARVLITTVGVTASHWSPPAPPRARITWTSRASPSS